MKQLVQDPASGAIEVAELAMPALRPGTLLVRTARSAISPGTERAMVATARSSWIRTARTRPDLVRRVLDSVQRDGVLAAYQKVRVKLAEPKALGYSSAGVVHAVAEGAGDHFHVGDRVACAGIGFASHAEWVAVPTALAAKVPDGVSFDDAAFATLGAIALHGVRQAEPALGERVAVIGLGIVGLFTVQILRAAGVRVAAFDLDPELVARAHTLGAEAGIVGEASDQVQVALAWSDGLGVDAVIVTAGSSGDGPMVAAAGMCRERGRVVAVGLVPFGLPRDIAYAKELELRISRSYGPGRYDAGFEEKGIDYPPGYVRWTQTRNLEAFLQLLAEGSVVADRLVTHRYRLADAPRAYDTLLAGGGPRPIGMLVEYDGPSDMAAAARPVPPPRAAVAGELGVAFVGAGAFARAVLLPQYHGRSGVRLRHVVTSHGLTAADARKRFGFEQDGTDVERVLADPSVGLVCITTRHDTHADLTSRALAAGKSVFVEKPLALDEAQLVRVEQAAVASSALLLVGFNRRFSPMARAVREALAGRGPLMMTYRVNGGALPAGHWLNDPEVGGGRVIGEGCHFVDLLSFLTGDADIIRVQAAAASSGKPSTEDVAIQLSFSDGSVGQILYTAKGDVALGKERLEAHAGGASAWIDDYRDGRIVRAGRATRLRGKGKGHGEETAALLEAIRAGRPSPIPLAVLARVTRATFEVHRSLRGGES